MSAQVEQSRPGQLLRGRLRRLLTTASPRDIAQALVRREVPAGAETTRLSVFGHGQDTRIQNSTVNTTVNYYYTSRTPLETNEQDEVPSEEVTMADGSPSSDTVQPSDDSLQSLTPMQQSIPRDPREVYIDIMITKNRGFPLWIPSPNTFLPPEYRYSGVSIGDVGVLTPEGAFDFIFNVFADASDPIHANSELMESFSPLRPLLRHTEIQRFKENIAGTLLGNDSFEQIYDAQETSVVLTTLESEAAVLLMPEDVYMVRMTNRERLRTYVSMHLTEWYSFIKGTLGRDLDNGDLRVVYGYRKSTAFGIAAKSTAKKPTETRLTFCNNDDWTRRAGYKYRWTQIGSADIKTGPEYEESAELMYPSFGTSRRLPENLCLFISTIDAKLSDETWKSIESSPVQVVDTITRSKSSGSSPVHMNFNLGCNTAATAECFSTGSYTINPSTQVLSGDILLEPEPAMHPSNLLNDVLLSTNPEARISVVCSDDWEDYMDCQDSLEFVSAVLCKNRTAIENSVVYLDSSSLFANEPKFSDNIHNRSYNSPRSHGPSPLSDYRPYSKDRPEIASDKTRVFSHPADHLVTHIHDDNQVQDSFDTLDDEEGNFDSYYQDDLEEEDGDDGVGGIPGHNLCIVCEARPAYSKNGKTYPTCGLACAGILKQAEADVLQQHAVYNIRAAPINRRANMYASGSASAPHAPARTASFRQAPVDGLVNNIANLSVQPRGDNPSGTQPTRNISTAQMAPAAHRPSRNGNTSTRGRGTGATTISNASRRQAIPTFPLCVVCVTKPCHDIQFVTCGLKCAEKLATSGPHDKSKCDYCHRRPKVAGKNQCGANCAEKAKLACLLCKVRPKLNRYHLCGRSCTQIATKLTPLILEAPEGHITYDQVKKKFQTAWKYPGTTIPTIKKVYKIIENRSFLQSYDVYLKAHGNKEVYRYHGTSKKCTLGAAGNTTLCNTSGCALCSIIRTTFKVSLANPSGAFGAGIYSSSASNKAYSYTGGGTGAMLLTKVVMGRVYNVNAFAQVSSCPSGYDSVVFDRQNGSLNETIVYTDDAIRPVFLIIFDPNSSPLLDNNGSSWEIQGTT